MRFRLSTLKLSKTIELHDAMYGELCATRMLQTHAPATFSVIVFILRCFRLSTLIRDECVFFLIQFQERYFSNRCCFAENAQRISVDEGPKRIEVYGFSNENALVWTGPVKRPKLQVTVHRIHWEFECHLTNELTDVFSCFPLGCSTYNRWKQCENSTRPCRTFSVIKRGSDQSGACCCWRHRIGEYPSFSLWR